MTPTIPGLEATELTTPEDFADSMAGDLELLPTEQDEHAKKLARAGFATHPSRRSSDREEAAAYWALRNEVNSTTTDNLGFSR